MALISGQKGIRQDRYSGETILELVPGNVGLRVDNRRMSSWPALGSGMHHTFIPRAGYRHREDVDNERKIEDFQGYSFISPHRLYYNSRDSVTTLIKTSPPTVQIPDITVPLFFA
ncbi:hypothetical protein PIB30_097568 [Stylosanthes scabra]|uniref:Uncharacterized protein n=1 Tax=Stylosanthes scabra TaxID=79078 RepID=A0ABU6TYP5_9FABA|nr:hypothetical protein [Stylosanthes scabra]